MNHNGVNEVEAKEKLSECEKSFYDNNGSIACKCPKRVAPPEFKLKSWTKLYEWSAKKYTGKQQDEFLTKYLKEFFASSSMNICQTQKLSMMSVQKMKVEFKDSARIKSPIKTTRIIPVPLPLREQSRRDLNNAVKMGILGDMSGQANYNLWLAPMIVLPKKDNTPAG